MSRVPPTQEPQLSTTDGPLPSIHKLVGTQSPTRKRIPVIASCECRRRNSENSKKSDSEDEPSEGQQASNLESGRNCLTPESVKLPTGQMHTSSVQDTSMQRREEYTFSATVPCPACDNAMPQRRTTKDFLSVHGTRTEQIHISSVRDTSIQRREQPSYLLSHRSLPGL